MCLLTSRGRCSTDRREPGKAHQHGGCIFPHFRLCFFSFPLAATNSPVTNINSAAFPVFSGHVPAAQLSHVAVCSSRQDLFDLVSLHTSGRLLLCQQCGAEITLRVFFFALSLRVQLMIAASGVISICSRGFSKVCARWGTSPIPPQLLEKEFCQQVKSLPDSQLQLWWKDSCFASQRGRMQSQNLLNGLMEEVTLLGHLEGMWGFFFQKVLNV